jgi:hypothetical protein
MEIKRLRNKEWKNDRSGDKRVTRRRRRRRMGEGGEKD